MGAQRFEATLEQHGSGTVVVVPFDLKEAFGSGRPPVRATVNGYSFRTTLFTMSGRALLGLNREVREAAGVEAGQEVSIELERDDEPRAVEVPRDLASALEADPAVRETFDGLSYTHRKEYVRWIEDAKRDETRTRRIAKAVEMLREGVKTPG
jgi:Bacteriocin-protection, YdeI or OmpD-Associated/Domain of unknown function (DUF1905)